MRDIFNAGKVTIQIDSLGKRAWVCTEEEMTVLRLAKITDLNIVDDRPRTSSGEIKAFVDWCAPHLEGGKFLLDIAQAYMLTYPGRVVRLLVEFHEQHSQSNSSPLRTLQDPESRERTPGSDL